MRDYHSEAKDLIDSGEFDIAIDVISSGCGEMQYAKSFVNLFFDGKQKELLTKVFENSDKSLEMLLQRATRMLSKKDKFYLSIETGGTVLLIFLTFILVFQAL